MCEARVHLQLTYYLASGKKEKQRGEGIKEGWGGEERKRKRNEREKETETERGICGCGGMELLGPQHFLGGLGGTCLHGGFCLCWTGWCGGPGPPEECFPLSFPQTSGLSVPVSL